MPSMPAPTPSPPSVVRCTVVATIQSPCVSQSVSAAQTRSTEASTSADATSSATAVLAPLPGSGGPGIECPGIGRCGVGCAGIGHRRDRLRGMPTTIEDAGRVAVRRADGLGS